MKREFKFYAIFALRRLAVVAVVALAYCGLSLIFNKKVTADPVHIILLVLLSVAMIVCLDLASNVCTLRQRLNRAQISRKTDTESNTAAQSRLYHENQRLRNTIETVENNIQMTSRILTEGVTEGLHQKIVKWPFDSVENFARYMKCFNDQNLYYIQDQMNRIEYGKKVNH